MKDKLDSVVYMWISFGLIVVAVLMMFVPLYTAEGVVFSATHNGGFFGNALHEGAWPSFIGYMLILVGGLITGVLALPFVEPSYEGEKLVLVVASILEFIGAALVMTCVVWYCLLNGQPELITHSGYYIQAGSYITMSFSVLAIACNVRAIILDK